MHSKHLTLTLCLAAGALLGSGCPAPRETAPRRTTARPAPNQADPAAHRAPPRRGAARELSVHALWDVKTGLQQATLAAETQGCLLVLAGDYLSRGTPQRELRCHAPATGKLKWKWSGGTAPLSFGSLDGSVIVLRDRDGKDHAVSLDTGKTAKLPASPRPRPKAAPLLWKGHKYEIVGTAVRCTDSTSGKAIWEAPQAGAAKGLQLDGDTIYFAVGTTRVIQARDARSGLVRWRHPVGRQPNVKHPGRADFTFRLVGSHLYVARYDGSLAAFAIRPAAVRPAPRR